MASQGPGRSLRVLEKDSFFDDGFFKEAWGDFDRAMQSVLDRFDSTGLKVEADSRNQCRDVYSKIRSSKIDEDLYASQALQITEKEGKFQVVMDVKDFNPRELQVRAVDDRIMVEGSYEKRSEDGSSSSCKSFYKEFTLPPAADIDHVSTALSKDGVLTIRAPKKDGAIPDTPKSNTTSTTIQQQQQQQSFDNNNTSSSTSTSSYKTTSRRLIQSSSSIDSNTTDGFESLPKEMRDKLMFSDSGFGSTKTSTCSSPAPSEAGSESSRVSSTMEFDLGKRAPVKTEIAFNVAKANPGFVPPVPPQQVNTSQNPVNYPQQPQQPPQSQSQPQQFPPQMFQPMPSQFQQGNQQQQFQQFQQSQCQSPPPPPQFQSPQPQFQSPQPQFQSPQSPPPPPPQYQSPPPQPQYQQSPQPQFPQSPPPPPPQFQSPQPQFQSPQPQFQSPQPQFQSPPPQPQYQSPQPQYQSPQVQSPPPPPQFQTQPQFQPPQQPQFPPQPLQQPLSQPATGTGNQTSVSVTEENGRRVLTKQTSNLVQEKDGFRERKETTAEITDKDSQAARREASSKLSKVEEDPEGKFKRAESTDAEEVSESCIQHLADGSVMSVKKNSTSSSSVKQSFSTSGQDMGSFFPPPPNFPQGFDDFRGLMGRGHNLMSQMSTDSMGSTLSGRSGFTDMSNFSQFSDGSSPFSDMSNFSNMSSFPTRSRNFQQQPQQQQPQQQQPQQPQQQPQQQQPGMMPQDFGSSRMKNFSTSSSNSSFSKSFSSNFGDGNF